MTDTAAERRQRAVERILEDEGLTGDLTDDQAGPLVQWACVQASQVAANPTQSDSEVDTAVGAIRLVVRQVAAAAPTEHDPQRLVALAQAALAGAAAPQTTAPAGSLPTAAPHAAQSAADLPDTPGEQSSPPPPTRLLQQRVKRWKSGWQRRRWRQHRS